jgi:hypothetical protein
MWAAGGGWGAGGSEDRITYTAYNKNSLKPEFYLNNISKNSLHTLIFCLFVFCFCF